MLDEYEEELVKEILSEVSNLKVAGTERIAKLALTLLNIKKEPKREQIQEVVDTIPVSHWI